MKTLQEVQKKEKELVYQIEDEQKNEEKPGSALRKHKSELSFLRICINYLKTNPSEDFLKKDFDRLLKRMELIIKDRPKVIEGNPFDKKKVADYDKKMEISSVRNQIKALRFLLN